MAFFIDVVQACRSIQKKIFIEKNGLKHSRKGREDLRGLARQERIAYRSMTSRLLDSGTSAYNINNVRGEGWPFAL